MSGQSWRINVETCSPEEFLGFLEDLRNELAEHWTMGPEDGQVYPLLTLPNNSVEWINIRLETSRNWIILRVSRANLYVKAFETSDGRLFELAENRSQQVFEGSRLLGFGGSYRELLGAAGRPNRGNITRLLQGVPLGLNRLRDAVNNLATSQSRRVAGESLLVMVWMMCEASRFRSVADRVATRSEVAVDAYMAQLVMLWGDLSRRVMQAFAYPLLFEFNVPDPVSGELGISTVAELLRILGIVLYTLPRFMYGKPSRRLKREAAEPSLYYTAGTTPQREATLFYYTAGATLVEVFYVTIDNIDNENPGDLYGTITVTDSYSRQYLFNRGREDYQSISPGQNALLTGPAKPISANDYFTIELLLTDRDADPSPDDEVVNDQFSWNPYEVGINEWNRSIKKVVLGRYGQATVCYGVFENAVVASVEVKVLRADDEDPAQVYGSVMAAKNLEEMALFSRQKSETVDVRPGRLIPLSRSIVIVPLSDALRISASLWDYDSLSADDNFADGAAIFTPKTQGTDKQNIVGPYGQVEVQVTWSIF